ncbi:MAG: PIN domain-containing protein [Microbacterium sp.]
MATSDAERVARQAHLQQAESDFDVLPFDAAAARAFGAVAASLRAAGRKPAAQACDALIAATAIAHDLPLFTCNPSDFTGIDHLDLRPVPFG